MHGTGLWVAVDVERIPELGPSPRTIFHPSTLPSKSPFTTRFWLVPHAGQQRKAETTSAMRVHCMQPPGEGDR